MGDIADSLINGTFDYITGEYLGEGLGFPRTKHNRHKTVSKRFVTSKSAPIRGVQKYLSSVSWIVDKQHYREIIDIYCQKNGETNKDLKVQCVFIQSNFNKFRRFIQKVNKNVNLN